MEKDPPEVAQKLRMETLAALARQYLGEAKRLDFSEAEIRQMLRDQLKSWDKSQANENE
jgi:DNA-binding transcriptional regulator YhcF (GntR family)